MIRFGDIKPMGWAREELEENMTGCIGNLDRLVPDLIQEHDIYHTDRLGKGSKLRELGRNDTGEDKLEENQEQFLWWNSETQSNWRDGFCRSAMLLGDEEWLEKVRAYLKKVQESCDDGYLGIYTPELRFACTGENGELWAQSTLFRVLIACYEYFRDPELLELLTQAVDRLMQGYPIYQSHPFCLKDPFAGAAHGLTITDALDRLYQLTGEEKYQKYALWLYEEYCAYEQSEKDLQIQSVANRNVFFQGHGVHTYEHFRALAIAAEADSRYQPLLERALDKLPYYLTPSGAPIGDEWIWGRCADASKTGYEFCSVHELLHTYCMLLEKSGNLEWADQAEWIYWNAAQGMKHPDESSIMYLKTDNCYTADEKRTPDENVRNPRYKYSPTHRDAAVCCVPNSGRILPYFLQSTVLETPDGYLLPFYNPVVFTGKRGETEVTLNLKTNYPKELTAQLEVSVSKPEIFDITLRFPQWATVMKVDGVEYRREEYPSQKVVLRREWSHETVQIEFDCKICLQRDRKGDLYITRGPLVYALEIPAQETITREYDVPGFCEKTYRSTNRHLEELRLKESAFSQFRYTGSHTEKWSDLTIEGVLEDGDKSVPCILRPMARTILRKVTFAPVNE